MLNKDAFKLSMETELKLRVITDEVNECRDIDELRKQLIASAKLIMHYQQMLNTILKQVIHKDLDDMILERKIK